jgi:diphthine synthase
LRAKERKIPVQAIHNASIMNAIGCCGLQLYNYGQTISIVFFTDTWRPDSFYDKILDNKKLGLHTLCLLDIKVQEQSIENMARGRKIYEPPRFMTVAQAAQQLLEVEEKRNGHICRPTDIAVGLARVGSSTQVIQAGTLAELAVSDLGSPLHTLILPGTMHFLEADMLRSFAINGDTFNANAIISQH